MRYVHQDHLGSTSVITDDTGAAVYEATYDPWGNVRTSTGAADTDRLCTGQRFDAATGLYYYNARYYDPYLARFTSPDTIAPGVGDLQAWNRYAYVLGNPMRYLDSSGRCIREGRPGEHEFEATDGNLFECTASQFLNLASWLQTAWFDEVFGNDMVLTSSVQAILNVLMDNPAFRSPIEEALGRGLRPIWDCYASLSAPYGCLENAGGFDFVANSGNDPYFDVNVSAPGITGGLIYATTGLYVYYGLCIGCAIGASLNYGIDGVSEGWSTAVQGAFWLGGQVGIDETESIFRELGIAYPPGAGYSHFYVRRLWGF
jgi:RHS repeat-associated protein